MEKVNIKTIQESLHNDDLLNRLEKYSVFLDQVVHEMTHDKFPEEDVSKLVEHIKIQKKIYENAHGLYESMKEENMEKETAFKKLDTLKNSLDEYHQFKESLLKN